jgi:hypothetical protein
MENKGLKIIGLFAILAIGFGRNSDSILKGCRPAVKQTEELINPKFVDETFKNFDETTRSNPSSFINNMSQKRSFIETEFEKEYYTNLRKKVEDGSLESYELAYFIINLEKLTIGFGAKNKITLRYKNTFVKTQSITAAKNSIIPKELKDILKQTKKPIDLSGTDPMKQQQQVFSYYFDNKGDERKNELFGLLTGQSLNQKQAEIISDITRRKFNATPDKYENYVLVNSDIDKKKLEVRSIYGISYNNKSTPFKGKVINNETRVIIKGVISEDLIKLCSKKNIRLVKPYSSFVKDLHIAPEKIQFVLVASENLLKLKSLFNISEEQAVKLSKDIEQIKKRDYFNLVDSKQELANTLNRIKEKGEHPVVIFNNVDNLLFGKTPSQLGITDFITCNSYKFKSTTNGYISTDYIYLNEILKSIDISKNRRFNSVDEFWNSVIKEYNIKLASNLNQKITVTAVLGTGIIGSSGYVIYLNFNKQKNN